MKHTKNKIVSHFVGRGKKDGKNKQKNHHADDKYDPYSFALQRLRRR